MSCEEARTCEQAPELSPTRPQESHSLSTNRPQVVNNRRGRPMRETASIMPRFGPLRKRFPAILILVFVGAIGSCVFAAATVRNSAAMAAPDARRIAAVDAAIFGMARGWQTGGCMIPATKLIVYVGMISPPLWYAKEDCQPDNASECGVQTLPPRGVNHSRRQVRTTVNGPDGKCGRPLRHAPLAPKISSEAAEYTAGVSVGRYYYWKKVSFARILFPKQTDGRISTFRSSKSTQSE